MNLKYIINYNNSLIYFTNLDKLIAYIGQEIYSTYKLLNIYINDYFDFSDNKNIILVVDNDIDKFIVLNISNCGHGVWDLQNNGSIIIFKQVEYLLLYILDYIDTYLAYNIIEIQKIDDVTTIENILNNNFYKYFNENNFYINIDIGDDIITNIIFKNIKYIV